MIEFKLNQMMAQRLRLWSEMVIKNDGHWGNGEATLPEEETLRAKLKKETTISIAPSELYMIYYWWRVACGKYSMDGIEEELTSEIKKIKSQIIDVNKALAKLNDPLLYEEGTTPIGYYGDRE